MQVRSEQKGSGGLGIWHLHYGQGHFCANYETLPLHQAWGDCSALILSNIILSDLGSFHNYVENNHSLCVASQHFKTADIQPDTLVKYRSVESKPGPLSILPRFRHRVPTCPSQDHHHQTAVSSPSVHYEETVTLEQDQIIQDVCGGHGGAAGSGQAWPCRGIMAARKQVRCGPDIYGDHLPSARVGAFAH